jgi:hypothetical protein
MPTMGEIMKDTSGTPSAVETTEEMLCCYREQL